MCGIFAYIGKKYKYDDLVHQINCIKHRGPDSSCHREIDNVLLAFHRLSIVDVSERGNQPMTIHGDEKIDEQFSFYDIFI